MVAVTVPVAQFIPESYLLSWMVRRDLADLTCSERRRSVAVTVSGKEVGSQKFLTKVRP
jgi:hypothetical protein